MTIKNSTIKNVNSHFIQICQKSTLNSYISHLNPSMKKNLMDPKYSLKKSILFMSTRIFNPKTFPIFINIFFTLSVLFLSIFFLISNQTQITVSFNLCQLLTNWKGKMLGQFQMLHSLRTTNQIPFIYGKTSTYQTLTS